MRRWAIVALLGLLVGAPIRGEGFFSNYNVEFTQTEGWRAGIERVVVVVKECASGSPCGVIRRAIEGALRTQTAWAVLPSATASEIVLGSGAFDYTGEHRAAVAERMRLDAVFELSVGEFSMRTPDGGTGGTIQLDVLSPGGKPLAVVRCEVVVAGFVKLPSLCAEPMAERLAGPDG